MALITCFLISDMFYLLARFGSKLNSEAVSSLRLYDERESDYRLTPLYVYPLNFHWLPRVVAVLILSEVIRYVVKRSTL